jgi:hypothetical protein
MIRENVRIAMSVKRPFMVAMNAWLAMKGDMAIRY